MLNIETMIDKKLWQEIETNYKTKKYTEAIKDAFYYLSELIRNKTNLEGDGASLIGRAFGGKQPKLKVNKLQSESDWNFQKGIEQILRGLYLAIRNPRSHEKYNDKVDIADPIILFLNYLVNIIDESKSPFGKEEIIRRIFDPDFAENNRYAEIIVNEIPPKQRFNIAVDIYTKKIQGDGNKLQYFFYEVIEVLTKDELKQFLLIVSDELKNTNSESDIRIVLQIIPSNYWEKIDEAARIRVENKLIKSVSQGTYHNKILKGAFGTWIIYIIDSLTLKDKLLSTLIDKLHSNEKNEEDYVFKYFSLLNLHNLMEEPPRALIDCINDGLERGNKRFYNYLDNFLSLAIIGKWADPFLKAYKSFEEKEEPNPLFNGMDDDEIPF